MRVLLAGIHSCRAYLWHKEGLKKSVILELEHFVQRHLKNVLKDRVRLRRPQKTKKNANMYGDDELRNFFEGMSDEQLKHLVAIKF
jgi:hypothetical protein